ncbi:MAG: redoxin domain-containing protein [Candidatus Eisenbacteria bacterium]|nr:redoxin domain-containing protein [Candidatus Eisenbacteria bacterium]
MRLSFALAVISGLALAAGCATKETKPTAKTGLPLSTNYATDLLARQSALSDSGYALLEQGKLEEAVAAFRAGDAVVPKGRFVRYNEACAYARSGKLDEAFAALAATVTNGFDDPDQLDYDPDLEPLKADPRFGPLVEQTKANRTAGEAKLAGGLPDYAGQADLISNPDSLKAWSDREQRRVRIHRNVWHSWETTAAQFDLEARRLAALALQKKDQPDWNYAQERVRTVARLRSPYEPWGAVTDAMRKEVTAYLATKPNSDGADEARYRAALAEYCRYRLDDAKDPNWASGAAGARQHLSAMVGGSKFDGSAAALGLWLDLVEAGEGRTALKDRVRDFATKYATDEGAQQMAGIFLQGDILAALWPLPFEATDIDGQRVTLADYRGKAVLIDFWATWCGPCRAELPGLKSAYASYHPKGFEVLSVSLDYADRTTPEQYRTWVTENGMPWRHIYDQQDWKGPLVTAFLVKSIPSPVMVGRDGSLIGIGDACRGTKLTATIEKALAASGA